MQRIKESFNDGDSVYASELQQLSRGHNSQLLRKSWTIILSSCRDTRFHEETEVNPRKVQSSIKLSEDKRGPYFWRGMGKRDRLSDKVVYEEKERKGK